MFETRTEFQEIECRVGACIRCKYWTKCKEGSQSVRIEKLFNRTTPSQRILIYGYDLCTDCIDELLEWIREGKNGADKPVDEKTS